MYAVIVAGGKQHRVAEGDRLRIDLIKGKAKGDSLVFDHVLFVKTDGGYKVGTPTVEGAKVEATVLDNGEKGAGVKGEKVWAFKKRRRKGYSKIRGHRQRYTAVRITKIHV